MSANRKMLVNRKNWGIGRCCLFAWAQPIIFALALSPFTATAAQFDTMDEEWLQVPSFS
jgi:hypothetical protein